MTKNNTLYSYFYSYLLFTLYQSNQDEKMEEIVGSVENRAESLETEKEQMKTLKANDEQTANESLLLETLSSGRLNFHLWFEPIHVPWKICMFGDYSYFHMS